MPFKSENQRRYLWANHPDIAEAWAHGKSSVTGKRESASEQGKRKKGVRQMARRGKRHSKRGHKR